jgi:arabinogalactan oligomer / maltooligosaccharide transport system permease protein
MSANPALATSAATQSPRQQTPASPDRTRARRARWWAEVGWKYPLALVIVAYAVFPLLYVASTALRPGGRLSGSSGLFTAFDLGNFADLAGTSFWLWGLNSLLVAGVTALATVLMGAAAAYAFSRFRFSGRRAGLTGLLLIQMFPQTVAFVAIFLMLLGLGEVAPVLGLNSKIALICIYLGGALGANTFLMYGFFNTIPSELDESARIDGASHAQIFWRIIMPLVTPALAVVGLLGFLTAFNDFILARIVLISQDNWTLAVGMYAWVSNDLNANWGLFAAGAVVAAIPVLVLFLALQRYIVGGLTAGAVKG